MSGEVPAGVEQALASVREQLVRLYEQAIATIDAIEDPQVAFEVATEHQAKIRDLHDKEEARASRLRARQAVRIREAEELSLAALADRIGVSKARADQLIRAAKASEEG